MANKMLPLLFLFASCFFACDDTAQEKNTLPASEYGKAIEQGGIQLLDVRTAEEYGSGHLKNALQADWRNQAQFKDRTQYLDRSKPVYVYCLSGGRSSAAADYLRQNGFSKVINLEGGITAWRNANMPVEGQSNVPQLSDQDYARMVSAGKIVLVDFGAPWCPPCKKMEPIVAEFKKVQAGKVTVQAVDGGAQMGLMKLQQVEALPTFILYVGGKEVWRKQGVLTLEEMNGLISKYGSGS
jgi:rhodanese-related sulfurtransferase